MKMGSLVFGWPAALSLKPWKAPSVEKGFASRPQPAVSVVHAGALLLMNQIIPETFKVTVPVPILPVESVTV